MSERTSEQLAAEQVLSLSGYSVVICHGDDGAFSRSLAIRLLCDHLTGEQLEAEVDERIAYSHTRRDGRSAPLRFDDINAELRKIREWIVERRRRACTSGFGESSRPPAA